MDAALSILHREIQAQPQREKVDSTSADLQLGATVVFQRADTIALEASWVRINTWPELERRRQHGRRRRVCAVAAVVSEANRLSNDLVSAAARSKAIQRARAEGKIDEAVDHDCERKQGQRIEPERGGETASQNEKNIERYLDREIIEALQ